MVIVQLGISSQDVECCCVWGIVLEGYPIEYGVCRHKEFAEHEELGAANLQAFSSSRNSTICLDFLGDLIVIIDKGTTNTIG